MKNWSSLKFCSLLMAFFCFVFGNTVANSASESGDGWNPSPTNSDSPKTIRQEMEEKWNCKTIVYNLKSNDERFLFNEHRPSNVSHFAITNDNSTGYICASAIPVIANLKLCSFEISADSYEILPNLSAKIGNRTVNFQNYELAGRGIYTLMECEQADQNVEQADKKVLVIFGKIGFSISSVALTLQLLLFCIVPSQRTPSGYNLAALSFALLLGSITYLIGEIPSVLGTACVAIGVLKQYFFLVAFFCMTVMAFDVWRMVKMPLNHISTHKPKSQFVCYSLYAWGWPALITAITVALDYNENVPFGLKPLFGDNNQCWITNPSALITFFTVPVFFLLFHNAIFFMWTARLLRTDRIKGESKQQKKIKDNYSLFAKLGVMMGITWLISIFGLIFDDDILWVIHDILNSLQGLFIFIISVLSTNVKKHIAERTSTKKTTLSEAQTSLSKTEKLSA